MLGLHVHFTIFLFFIFGPCHIHTIYLPWLESLKHVNWSYLFHIHATTICVLDKKTGAMFAPTGFQIALNTFKKKCV